MGQNDLKVLNLTHVRDAWRFCNHLCPPSCPLKNQIVSGLASKYCKLGVRDLQHFVSFSYYRLKIFFIYKNFVMFSDFIVYQELIVTTGGSLNLVHENLSIV